MGAVLGFSNMLVKLLNDFRARRIAIVFDAARRNFRYDIYPEYKANRAETPEDLVPQFPLIREATRAFSVPAVEQEGFEADDLIAAYVARARENGREVVVVGSDKDLYQLIREGVKIYDPMKSAFVGPAEVAEHGRGSRLHVGALFRRGQHHDRDRAQRRVLLELAKHVQSVDLGQLQVQQALRHQVTEAEHVRIAAKCAQVPAAQSMYSLPL